MSAQKTATSSSAAMKQLRHICATALTHLNPVELKTSSVFCLVPNAFRNSLAQARTPKTRLMGLRYCVRAGHKRRLAQSQIEATTIIIAR
jgi:hypothetical protein